MISQAINEGRKRSETKGKEEKRGRERKREGRKLRRKDMLTGKKLGRSLRVAPHPGP